MNNRNHISEDYVKWDKNYSTFYWNIIYNPNILYNGRKQVKEQPGYSKAQGRGENTDKQKRLQDIVAMLNQHYINQCNFIYLYRRWGTVINKHKDYMILILTPKNCVWMSEDPEFEPTPETIKSIDNIYLERNNPGAGSIELPLKTIKQPDRDIFLDIDYQHMKIGSSFEELEHHCDKLRKYGHRIPVVVDFFNAYKMKYLG